MGRVEVKNKIKSNVKDKEITSDVLVSANDKIKESIENGTYKQLDGYKVVNGEERIYTGNKKQISQKKGAFIPINIITEGSNEASANSSGNKKTYTPKEIVEGQEAGIKEKISTSTGTLNQNEKKLENANQKVNSDIAEDLTGSGLIEQASENTIVEGEDLAGSGLKSFNKNDTTQKSKKEGDEEDTEVSPQYKEFFERNILHDYDTATYHFTLSMLSERDAIKAQDHIVNGNYNNENWTDWAPEETTMVIAETGSTVLSINSVQIEATAGPINNGKRLTGAVDFMMTIQQPLKASFTDTIVNAAISLGLPDGLKATYLLDLHFIGRDPTTGAIVNPIPDSQRQFLVSIIDVKASVDTNGATYEVRAVRAGDFGIRQQVYQTDRPLQLSNLKTVNDMLTALQQTLNVNELDKLAIEKGILDEYYISLDPKADETLGDDEILITGKEGKPIVNSSYDEDDDIQNKQFMIPQGTSIDRILEFGITHSKKLQTLAKGLKDGADPDSSDAEDVDKFVKLIYKIKVDVKNIKWDIIRNDYAREYHYTISLYPTIRPEILPGVWKDQPDVAMEKIKSLLSQDISKSKSKPYRALSKRYDYLFTGLNDKVLRFDIK